VGLRPFTHESEQSWWKRTVEEPEILEPDLSDVLVATMRSFGATSSVAVTGARAQSRTAIGGCQMLVVVREQGARPR